MDDVDNPLWRSMHAIELRMFSADDFFERFRLRTLFGDQELLFQAAINVSEIASDVARRRKDPSGFVETGWRESNAILESLPSRSWRSQRRLEMTK